VIQVHAGEAIDIPLESAHRVANQGDTDVVLIEVPRGTYFGEDDIVRLDDDYGRVEAGAGDTGNGTGGAGKVPSP
jgi:mannose-6-phosphate isomerase